jgi:hypothetical protein
MCFSHSCPNDEGRDGRHEWAMKYSVTGPITSMYRSVGMPRRTKRSRRKGAVPLRNSEARAK